MQRFVHLFVCANSSAVEERVQRLLFPVLRQAAEPPRACPGVHTTRLALSERAGLAAPATGFLHQLASDRHRRTHGERLLVTRFTRHIRAATILAQEKRY